MQQVNLLADEKQVKLSVEPRDSSLLVRVDIAKLERVLTNLVDNALRHCDRGDSIRITFDRRSAEKIQVQVQVTDTGRGIEPEDLPHIFEPHYRGASPSEDSRIHSGLGLAITRRLLELHGAEISVASRPREGTVFSFELPAADFSTHDR